jgi:hypothetical protein
MLHSGQCCGVINKIVQLLVSAMHNQSIAIMYYMDCSVMSWVWSTKLAMCGQKIELTCSGIIIQTFNTFCPAAI